MTLEETLEKILKIFETIYPKSDSIQILETGSITLSASSFVRLTFTVAEGYKARLKKLYADARDGCSYKWIVSGVSYDNNEVEVDKPIDVFPKATIVFYVENIGAVNQVVDYHLRGWGDELTPGGGT